MLNCIKSIVIVGGGTAGWMVASRLSAKHQASPDSDISITLIESPTLKPVGVGEGTWPTMRTTLQAMGISESEFIRECDATFKQGTKFNGWVTGQVDDHYYHPFVAPQAYNEMNMLPFWQAYDKDTSFSRSMCYQEQICEQGLAPKQITTPEYASVANYGYHLNAGKFSALLKRHCMEKYSVKHVLDDVIHVNSAENGDIASLSTKMHDDIAGDLFIDCSGFNCLLLGEHFKVPFIEKLDTLFVDSALAVQIPYEHEGSPISTVTQSTATSAGWIWDIPMKTQRSIGYVHSGDFINAEDAEREMRAYQGAGTEDFPSRVVKFKVGCREQAWKGNCVAIGLSNGFIEPLESTGLYLSDLGAVMLAEHFPFEKEHMDAMAFRYNRIISNRFYEILDFINMHYCLTKRTDTEFWKTVQLKEHITDRLQAKFEYWKMKPPSASDFDDQFLPGQSIITGSNTSLDPRTPVDTAGLWNHESYQCIMYGMDFMGDEIKAKYGENLPPSQVHPQIYQRLQAAKTKLPPHHIWLKEKVGMKDYPTAAKPDGWV